jgi:hypothetical protein
MPVPCVQSAHAETPMTTRSRKPSTVCTKPPRLQKNSGRLADLLGWDSCEQRSCGPSRISALGRLESHRAIPQPRSSDRDSKLFQARSFFSCLLGSSSAEKLLGSEQSGLIVRRCLHLYAWLYAALLRPSSSHAAVLDGSATRRRRAGLHAKNRMTEEPNAAKVARSDLQTSRSREGAA